MQSTYYFCDFRVFSGLSAEFKLIGFFRLTRFHLETALFSDKSGGLVRGQALQSFQRAL